MDSRDHTARDRSLRRDHNLKYVKGEMYQQIRSCDILSSAWRCKGDRYDEKDI